MSNCNEHNIQTWTDTLLIAAKLIERLEGAGFDGAEVLRQLAATKLEVRKEFAVKFAKRIESK